MWDESILKKEKSTKYNLLEKEIRIETTEIT